MGSLIALETEVDCTIAVTPGTTLFPSDAPITPHLHPDVHASQDRDVTTQGKFYTQWAADTFAQKLHTALGPHAIAPFFLILFRSFALSSGAEQIL